MLCEHYHTPQENLSFFLKVMKFPPVSGFPVAQIVEHGASNAKIMGSIPRERADKNVKTVTWMQCKLLWIKASAKCINVNVSIYTISHDYYCMNGIMWRKWQWWKLHRNVIYIYWNVSILINILFYFKLFLCFAIVCIIFNNNLAEELKSPGGYTNIHSISDLWLYISRFWLYILQFEIVCMSSRRFQFFCQVVVEN